MKRWVMILVPIVALGTLIAWRLREKQSAAKEQTKARQTRAKAPPMVSVDPAAIRDVIQTFDGIGSVESPFSVKIAPKVAGLITYLQVREGDRVTAGQVVAKIDPAQIEAQVRQRQAELAEARSR